MNSRVRFIFMGLFASAVISFAGVSCMQFMSRSDTIYIDTDTLELVQTEQPKEGDTIAVIKTSLGDIKAVLYPEFTIIHMYFSLNLWFISAQGAIIRTVSWEVTMMRSVNQ